MGKQVWKPGNMLYPLPVVMVSVRDRDGQDNIITVAWAERSAPIRQWCPFLCVQSVIPTE